MTRLRLLLDQMIDSDVATDLRAAGHNIGTVSELSMARADDAQILEVAIQQDRILVTLDDDFGDWAVLPLAHHPGVIRIKANPTTTEMIESVLFPSSGHSIFARRSMDSNRDLSASTRNDSGTEPLFFSPLATRHSFPTDQSNIATQRKP